MESVRYNKRIERGQQSCYEDFRLGVKPCSKRLRSRKMWQEMREFFVEVSHSLNDFSRLILFRRREQLETQS